MGSPVLDTVVIRIDKVCYSVVIIIHGSIHMQSPSTRMAANDMPGLLPVN